MMPTTMTEPCAREHRQRALAERGQQASRLAHEIRNPLSAMRMQAAVIHHRLEGAPTCDLEGAKEGLDNLDREISRLEDLVHSFLETGHRSAHDDNSS